MITKEQVVESLKQVFDPHIGVDIYSLGLIYEIKIDNNNIDIDMTLTNPGCPMAKSIIGEAKKSVSSIAGVEKVEINLVFDPPWTMDRMSDELKKRWNIPTE
ncbi:MAG: iron-sulfur cluster assembly protein [bacterium]|nr:iron-sulfur cluster assembly protein [bacterium]